MTCPLALIHRLIDGNAGCASCAALVEDAVRMGGLKQATKEGGT